MALEADLETCILCEIFAPEICIKLRENKGEQRLLKCSWDGFPSPWSSGVFLFVPLFLCGHAGTGERERLAVEERRGDTLRREKKGTGTHFISQNSFMDNKSVFRLCSNLYYSFGILGSII